jgi:hypothetical protein
MNSPPNPLSAEAKRGLKRVSDLISTASERSGAFILYRHVLSPKKPSLCPFLSMHSPPSFAPLRLSPSLLKQRGGRCLFKYLNSIYLHMYCIIISDMFGVKKFDSNQIRNHIRKFRINYKILIYNTIPQLSPPSLLQQRGGPGG